MTVGVDKAWEDESSLQVDHASRRTGELRGTRVRPDIDDVAVPDRDRLRRSMCGVAGIDDGVLEDEVGGLRRRAGRGKRDERREKRDENDAVGHEPPIFRSNVAL